MKTTTYIALLALVATLHLGCEEAPPDALGPTAEDPGVSHAPSHPTLLPPVPAVVAPDLEPPVQEVRGFGCTPEAVGEEMVIGQLADGGAIRIRPAAGAEECTYHLFHTSPAGAETQLSDTPGGYLFALGWASGLGDVAICASNIQHQAVQGQLRKIDTVALECVFQVSGLWTGLAPVVVPDGPWAAWPRALDLVADGVLALDYVRDSTFNLLNMSDAGRPPEDGVYRRTFTVTPSGFDVGEVQKLADRTNPFDGPKLWEPTPEQLESSSDVIDFSDGECPNGCDAPLQ